MNCDQIQQSAPAFLSGELTGDRAVEFQAHLASCAECRLDIASQVELDARLRRQVLADQPDASALDRRVLEAIAVQPKRRFVSMRLAAAGIAAVLILAIVVAVRSQLRAQPVELCADAARDHLREIVNQEPRRWTSDRAGIDALAKRVGLGPQGHGTLAGGYQLERGRLCRLDGRVFLHLVYSNGSREFSLFLASAGAFTDGASFATDVSGEHVATLQSGRERAVVVTEEPGDAARSLARIAMSSL